MSATHESGKLPRVRKRLPIMSAAVSGLVGLASWKSNTDFVQRLAEVHANSSWLEWAYRWPGSFFEASPFFGKLTDTAVAVGTTAIAFGVTEQREGIRRTLKLAAVSQFAGCSATRMAAVTGLVSSEYRSELDVGPSAVTVALGANYLTRRMREGRSPRDALACKVLLGASALGLAAVAVVDPNITDVVGHAAGFMCGYVGGRIAPLSPRTSQLGETA
jgi:hypothetical protein